MNFRVGDLVRTFHTQRLCDSRSKSLVWDEPSSLPVMQVEELGVLLCVPNTGSMVKVLLWSSKFIGWVNCHSLVCLSRCNP